MTKNPIVKQMLKKPKKQRTPKVDVHGSRPHRQRGGWVNGYWRLSSSGAWRNDPHHRNPRRTQTEISLKGTRKDERARKRQEKRLQKLEREQQKLKNKQAKNYTKQMDIRAAMQNIPRSK